MHSLEFGIFALGEIIRKELGNHEIADWAKGLADASHIYDPMAGEDERLGKSDLIEVLRQRSGLGTSSDK